MATPKTAGGGSLTREQFLRRELRIVADLRTQGASDDEIIERVKRENLFQYRTERMLGNRTRVCLQRLDALRNDGPAPAELVQAPIAPGTSTAPATPTAPTASAAHETADQLTEIVAHGTPEAAAQVDLYAMLRRYALLREFFTTEIAERLRCFNYAFTALDMNAFFTRYRLENAQAATWTDSTVARLKTTLSSCLRSVGMLDSLKTGNLSPLMLDFQVEALMRANGDADLVAALSGTGVA